MFLWIGLFRFDSNIEKMKKATGMLLKIYQEEFHPDRLEFLLYLYVDNLDVTKQDVFFHNLINCRVDNVRTSWIESLTYTEPKPLNIEDALSPNFAWSLEIL